MESQSQALLGQAAPPILKHSIHHIVCPCDRSPLSLVGNGLICTCCEAIFPIVGDVPILINDSNSVFAIADYVEKPGYEGAGYGRDWDKSKSKSIRRFMRRVFRRLADAPSSMRHISDSDAISQVRACFPNPKILVVGAGGRKHGEAGDQITCIDVAMGPGVDYVADAHDLPFPDDAFDMVIAIALLEHVADPQRCVTEFGRVLRPDGFVYAITPFLQPVHMGAYDFTRYTLLGHRRLFRHFDVIDAGAALGVGTVAAWTLSAFMRSVPLGRIGRQVMGAIALLSLPPLRALDRFLSGPTHLDAAGGCYFFGRLRLSPVPDRTIIQEYKGAFSHG